MPFEMVDAVLAATRTTQKRVRDLPSRVVVYLLLAAGLFPEVGWLGVWRKLTAGLAGVPVACPSGAGLAAARRRVGPAPLQALFDLLRGPAAGLCTRGVWWRGLLVVAVDGTTMACADTGANTGVATRGGGYHGGTGYPLVRLLVLVGCGTRTVIDAVFGPLTCGETTYAARLLSSLHAGMIVLADRNFAAAKLITTIAATEADLLIRVRNDRRLPVCARLRDGSYLSRIGPVTVRVIAAQITICTPAGRTTGIYRLITTVLDADATASQFLRLYHDRWEIETTYLEIKSTILGGRVLRARTAQGVVQEIYALLVTYQAIRLAITDAITVAAPGTDPDRGSFTVALHAARDQVIQAAGVITETTIDLIGAIGAQVLQHLLPARRLRTTPRVVKRAISKFVAKGDRVRGPTYQATITIDILTDS